MSLAASALSCLLIEFKFFLRTSDADVHRYLKLFTFESLDVLENLVEEHMKEPSKRIAQRKLAQEVIQIVHGKEALKEAEQEHGFLFKNLQANRIDPIVKHQHGRPEDINRSLNKYAPIVTAEKLPPRSTFLPRSLVYDVPIARVLFHAGLVASRSEGHRLIAKRGAYLGARPGGAGTMGEQVDFSPAGNWDGKETQKYIIGDDILIFRVGKWKVKLIKIISDEEFESKGLTAPGWKDANDTKATVLEGSVKNTKPWHERRYLGKALLHKSDAEKEGFNTGTKHLEL